MTSIDSAHYRSVLGHFPTGVTVVAGLDDGDPVGLAIGSFFSISIEPPLVGFCVGKQSGSWARMVDSGSFCVNVLGADQQDVCQVFATSGDDKFAEVAWTAAGSGSPLIDGVLAWIDCDVDAIHDGGDHHIVVGRVRAMDAPGSGDPLLFFQGRYAAIG